MLDFVKNMMERYKLEKFPSIIIIKVICFLLSLALTGVMLSTFYRPEKYDTVEDVKESRAFAAVVDAAGKAYKQAMSKSDALWGTQNFSIDNIAWIYAASFNGYNVYSKIDYTLDGESDTAYCETWCGEILSRYGKKDGIETKLISEEKYGEQKSRFINSLISSEQEYNDLAVATVFLAMARDMSFSVRGYSNLVSLFETLDFLQEATVHSASYTYREVIYVGAGLTKCAVFALDCTISGSRQTLYFSSEIRSKGTILTSCNALAKMQYEALQSDYLSYDAIQGIYGNTICLAALLEAKEGA